MNDQSAGLPASTDIAKAQAKRLRSALAPDFPVGHSQSLELIARVHGEQSWGRLNAILPTPANLRTAAPAAAPVTAPAPAAAALKAHDTTAKFPDNHVEQRALQGLLGGLRKAKDTQPSGRTLTHAREILKEEIVSLQAFESYLDSLDVRMGGMVFDMRAEALVSMAGLETVSRYERPGARDAKAFATIGLRPASFAAGLIWLERLGFDTHPELIYEPLIPAIKKAKFISQDELTCLWHIGEKKGRFQTSEYFIDAVSDIPSPVEETFDGRGGLKITVSRGAGELGLIKSLRVYR